MLGDLLSCLGELPWDDEPVSVLCRRKKEGTQREKLKAMTVKVEL